MKSLAPRFLPDLHAVSEFWAARSIVTPAWRWGSSQLLRWLANGCQLRILGMSVGLSLGLCGGAHAWGALGHQAVALIAQARIQSTTQAAVAQLLAQEEGATLASVSVWADRVVNTHSGPWHYINFEPGQCRSPQAARCEPGVCITAVMHQQLEVLRQSSSESQRLDALKYLVHFVGDVHQPLHAGFAHDRGGNRFQLRFDSKGSNLHRLWDSGLFESLALDASGLAAAAMALPQGPAASMNFAPEAWASESCALVQAEGFYPELSSGRELPQAYVQAQTPVALQRLRLAGERLAALLDEAFGPPGKPSSKEGRMKTGSPAGPASEPARGAGARGGG